MKTTSFMTSWALILVLGLFTACSDDETTPAATALETKTFTNLHAPQTGGQGQPVGGAFTKFSFAQNAVVTDDSWDIAFRGTTLLVNGEPREQYLGGRYCGTGHDELCARCRGKLCDPYGQWTRVVYVQQQYQFGHPYCG
jgi:hypothetical protein